MDWYYESDGGGWWEGDTRIEQPKTHYLVNDLAGERVDCKNKRDAMQKLAKLKKLEALKAERDNLVVGNEFMPEGDPQAGDVQTELKRLEQEICNLQDELEREFGTKNI